MKVKLISYTNSIDQVTPENLIVYCARVSNPENQNNTKTSSKLIEYLIKNKHWSPFELVDITFEIETTRAISPQLLRHRSFSFQEFSLRYSAQTEFEVPELRKQGKTNRQSSEEKVKDINLEVVVNAHLKNTFDVYEYMLNEGVSRETARSILPLNTKTTLYMKGSLRSWIHYLSVRLEAGTQKEHREIAVQIHGSLKGLFPNVFKALEDIKYFDNE